MVFIKLLIYACLSEEVLNQIVLNKIVFSNDKQLAQQISQLINNSSYDIVGTLNNGVNYRAMDITKEILNNLSSEKTVILGKIENQQPKLDVLLYFTIELNTVSYYQVQFGFRF